MIHKLYNLLEYLPSLMFRLVQIGVMVMLHGDDKGLILPPKVAVVQVVVPVPYKDAYTEAIFNAFFQQFRHFVKQDLELKLT